VYTETARSRERQEQRKSAEQIGDLLRFAPGRLGARQDRAPLHCVVRLWVVPWLSCVDLGDELDTEAHAIGGSRLLVDRDGNRQRKARMRQPWLAKEENERLSRGAVVSSADV
jgi:hypothetical protein